MDFAKEQLTKHGWKDGCGLGRTESGMKEAVKVKIKNDNRGVGHDSGAEFTFHWWDHMFNKAASSIDVKHTETGVEINNSALTERSKKKTRTYDSKAMLYGQFVKGSTLDKGTEVTEKSERIEEPEETPIKHALIPDNEEEVFKRCGGRTAHKGARHGLKANGKLQRIEQQEQLLLEQLTANQVRVQRSTPASSQSEQTSKHLTANQGQGQRSTPDSSQSEQTSTDTCNNGDSSSTKKTKKSKRKNKNYEKPEESVESDVVQIKELTADNVDIESEVVSKKKKKRKRQEENLVIEEGRNNDVGIDGEEVVSKKKKKSKKRKRQEEAVAEESDNNTIREEETVEKKVKKKKKKKS